MSSMLNFGQVYTSSTEVGDECMRSHVPVSVQHHSRMAVAMLVECARDLIAPIPAISNSMTKRKRRDIQEKMASRDSARAWLSSPNGSFQYTFASCVERISEFLSYKHGVDYDLDPVLVGQVALRYPERFVGLLGPAFVATRGLGEQKQFVEPSLPDDFRWSEVLDGMAELTEQLSMSL